MTGSLLRNVPPRSAPHPTGGGPLRFLGLATLLLLALVLSNVAGTAGVTATPEARSPSSLAPTLAPLSERSTTVAASPWHPAILPPTDGWLLYQGTVNRTGLSPDAPPPTTNVAWQGALPPFEGQATSVSAPLVSSGGMVYVASLDGAVYAFDAVNGTVEWSFATHGGIYAAPEVHNGLLLVNSADGYLYELNASNGGMVTHLHDGSGDSTAAPMAVGDQVVVPCWSTRLCGFSLTGGGAPTWNESLGSTLYASPSTDVSSNELFVATTGGVLYALYGTNGTELWQYTFASPLNTITTTPVVGPVAGLGRSLVFVFASSPSQTGVLAAFNETSSKVLLRHDLYNVSLGSGFGTSSPALTSTGLYVATENGAVLALDPATGALLWNVSPWPGNTNPIVASVIDASGTLLVGLPSPTVGGGEVAELDAASGGVVTTVGSPTGNVVSTPALESSGLYFASFQGEVYAVGTAVPSAPASLTVVGLNNTLNLTWTPPAELGGLSVNQYVLSWGVSPGPLSSSSTVGGSVLSHDLSGLADATRYAVEVQAVNAEGEGLPVYGNGTPGALPAAPVGPTVSLGSMKFLLTWRAPSYTGNLPVVGYDVETWNSSSWTHSNISVGTTPEWVASGVPNGVTIYAEVAAVTGVGQGPFTAPAWGAPWLAPAVLNLLVMPASARGVVSITLNGHAQPFTVGNGSARVTLVPGTYWVNATGSGWLPYDVPVSLTSGNVTSLNVTMQYPPRNLLGLTNDEVYAIGAGALVLLVVGVLVIGLRFRKLQQIAEGEEEEPEEEEGGLSEKKARTLLQAPTTGAAGGAAASAAPIASAGDEAEGEVEEDREASGPVREGSDDEEDGEEEGASGALGSYLRRRRMGKETLKSPEENTREEEPAPTKDPKA